MAAIARGVHLEGGGAVAATNCGRMAQHAAFSTFFGPGKSTTTRASMRRPLAFSVRMTSRGPCPTGTDPRTRPAVARRTRQLAPRAGRWIRWPPFAPPLPSPPPRRASARTSRRIKPPRESRVPSSPIAGPAAPARRPRARRPPRRPPRRAPRPRTRYAASIFPNRHALSPRSLRGRPSRRLATTATLVSRVSVVSRHADALPNASPCLRPAEYSGVRSRDRHRDARPDQHQHQGFL